MKTFFYIIVLLTGLLVSCSHAHAQFDDSKSDADEFGDDKSNKKKSEEATKELPQAKEKDEAAATESGEPKSAEVTKADHDQLAAAFKMKSESQLIKATSNILSKDPNNLEALNALAVHYFEDKKLGMAKIVLKRALKEHPKEPALENNLGIIYLSENEMGLAIEQFRKSIADRADYRIGATNLSSIYLEYSDYKRSIAPLEESYKAARSDISRDPNAVDIANNYGVALIGIGENDKAETVFSEIVAANSRNPIPYLNYAILLVEVQKKKKDAVRVISKLKFMTDDRDILRRVDELERKLE